MYGDGAGNLESLYIRSNAGTMLQANQATGDISFYEDTGTTPKFFWDASAESLGIGTSSPNSVLDVRKNSPSGGRVASFGSNGTRGTAVATGISNTISLCRTYITVQPNTTTNLVDGYGGSHVMMVLSPASGVADVQYTIVATHAWSSALVLFSQTYGSNAATFTFSASAGVLRVSHNHSGAIEFAIACLVSPNPSAG